jgi:hypothetical protein
LQAPRQEDAPLSFSDVEELRREQALLLQRRLAEMQERAPERPKRRRHGEEPYLRAHEDALVLYWRTHGH